MARKENVCHRADAMGMIVNHSSQLMTGVFILLLMLLQCWDVYPNTSIIEARDYQRILVDNVSQFAFIMDTNNFQRIIRHKNVETGLIQQSILFYAPADGNDEEFLISLRQQYCERVAYQATTEACENLLQMVLDQYRAYCQKQNNTIIIRSYDSQVVDIGFTKRMNERNEHFKKAKQQNPHKHIFDLTYYDVFSTLSDLDNDNDNLNEVGNNEKKNEDRMDSNRNKCNFQNCGGDLAVIVTGYWELSKTKYYNDTNSDSNTTIEVEQGIDNQGELKKNTSNPYYDWFNNSLQINMPYIIFSDLELLPILFQKRHGLPSLFIPYNFDAFYLKDENIIPEEWTFGNKHIPSRELSKIWLEKMNMVSMASQIERNALFYVWVDAGLATYRHRLPPSEEWSHEVLLSLPKDRISFCQIEGEYHSFPAGVIVFPRTMVRFAHFLFYQMYRSCLEQAPSWKCGSEQYLWTEVWLSYPEIFHVMSYNYGEIAFLWGSTNQPIVL